MFYTDNFSLATIHALGSWAWLMATILDCDGLAGPEFLWEIISSGIFCFPPYYRWHCSFASMTVKLVLAQASYEIDCFCNEISHIETMVRFLAGVKIWQSYFFNSNLMETTAAVPICVFSKSHCQSELLAATGEVPTYLFIWEMKLKPQLISKSHRFGRS